MRTPHEIIWKRSFGGFFIFISRLTHTHTHFRLNGNFFWYGVKKWKDAHHFLFSSVSSLTVNADGYDAVSLEERIFPVLSCYGKITKNKRPISLTDGHRQTTRAEETKRPKPKKCLTRAPLLNFSTKSRWIEWRASQLSHQSVKRAFEFPSTSRFGYIFTYTDHRKFRKRFYRRNDISHTDSSSSSSPFNGFFF